MKLTMQTESEFENNGGFDYHPFNINIVRWYHEINRKCVKEVQMIAI